jgi:hypothetical protein
MNSKNYEKPLAELICFDLAAVRMGVGLDSTHIDTAAQPQKAKSKADFGDLD